MKRRTATNGVGPPTDLLVCFPSRSHLTLMPKPLCSPSRPTNPSKRHHHHSTPLFRPNKPTKPQSGSDPTNIGSEPTSPKVTCAGQIKIRDKKRTTHRPDAKTWLDALGLKKDLTNFLAALRGLRFNMQCFGSLHGTMDYSSEEDDDDDDTNNNTETIFSKWFMVLEEKNQLEEEVEELVEEEENSPVPVPPANALLLMRCQSAPAKGWVSGDVEVEKKREEKRVMKGSSEERLMLMSYAPDFFKVSTEIAKETWVVGSVDPLVRSRSWKR